MEDVEGDQWAFLAKGLPLHKPIGLDNKTMLFLKRALFLHSFAVGAGVGVGAARLTNIKDYCLIRLFYSGQLLCSCFSIESCLASNSDFWGCICVFQKDERKRRQILSINCCSVFSHLNVWYTVWVIPSLCTFDLGMLSVNTIHALYFHECGV